MTVRIERKAAPSTPRRRHGRGEKSDAGSDQRVVDGATVINPKTKDHGKLGRPGRRLHPEMRLVVSRRALQEDVEKDAIAFDQRDVLPRLEYSEPETVPVEIEGASYVSDAEHRPHMPELTG
ncbi:MAG TPA: hypothetical protein VG929_03920 [Actinomycetota bacterium]|nr:hypothetical protein [Actinomycetota bacterium]